MEANRAGIAGEWGTTRRDGAFHLGIDGAAEEAFAVVEGDDLAGGEAALWIGESDECGGRIKQRSV